MKKTLLAASIALTLGASAVVTAQVDILVNGGAEDGVLAPWTGDGKVISNLNNVNTGAYAFKVDDTTADACNDADNKACIEQEVSISDAVGDLTCLTGIDEESVPNSSVKASGYVKVRTDGDIASLSVSDGAASQSAVAIYIDDTYKAIETGPLPLPDPYDMVTVNLEGTGAEGTELKVFGDDLELNLTCVTDYVKAGGREGAKGNKGKGKGKGAPDTETFEGGFWHEATGVDTVSGVMGMLTINNITTVHPTIDTNGETWVLEADGNTSLTYGGTMWVKDPNGEINEGEYWTADCDARVDGAQLTRTGGSLLAPVVDTDADMCFVARDKEIEGEYTKWFRGEVFVNGITDNICNEATTGEGTDDCLVHLSGGNVIVDEGVVPE